MKTIIAGSRKGFVFEDLLEAIKLIDWKITEVISGGALGVDQYGIEYARLQGIPYQVFPAFWEREGRSAGPIRNTKMAEYADALIALWDTESRGTRDMIIKAKSHKLKCLVWTKDGILDMIGRI